MTDVTGSNLVIACCPLDVWRKQRRLFFRRTPLQAAIV
jgi:hypothetical protein